MMPRATLLSLVFLAGCAAGGTASAPGTMSSAAPPPSAAAPTPSSTPAAGASDWALAIVGTPFVFAFRVVTCAATAVMAAPTAGLLAFTEEYRPGLAYLRDGLAQNCGPPYGVPVPVAGHYDRDPYHDPGRYHRDPYVPGPRPLVRPDHS